MKAILWTKYGSPDLLKFGEIEKPEPKKDEVLIRVHAATVTAGDCEIRRFQIHPLFWLPLRIYIGLFKPRMPVLGQEFSGEIEAIGKDVTQFKVGDQVFGGTGIRFGAYAEYRTQKSTFPMAIKPRALSHEVAATITTGGINAMHFLRMAKMEKGQHILINGAGGSIGTYACQIAKEIGAEVTCVDSKNKLDMLRSIGADHVIDYAEQDFTKGGKTYHAIIDIAGGVSYSRAIRCLKTEGRLMLGNPPVSAMMRSFWTNIITDKRVIWKFAGDNVEDLNYLKGLIVDGKIKSVIDKRYPLKQVPEAHHYVDQGLKAGNVVINIPE